MIYVASPYSHGDPDVMYRRYLLAKEFTAEGIRQGYMAYSLIVHCHFMAVDHDLPTSAEFWRTYDEHFIRLSSSMIVLGLKGWRDSIGVSWEIDLFKSLDKRVFLAKPVAYEYGRFCVNFWKSFGRKDALDQLRGNEPRERASGDDSTPGV